MSHLTNQNYLTIHLHPGSISDRAFAVYELTGVHVSSNHWGHYWVDGEYIGNFYELESHLESLYEYVCSDSFKGWIYENYM